MTDGADQGPLVLTTTHVLDDGLPVLRVVKDLGGDLQLLDDRHAPAVADARTVHLHHLLARDPGLAEVLASLPDQHAAAREDVGGSWRIEPLPPPEPWRLAAAEPELVDQLQALDPRSAAAFAVAVVEQLCAGRDDPGLRRGLAAAQGGAVGDGEVRDEVGQRCQELDDQDPQEGTEEFLGARAALALWYALSDDPYEAAAEAAYESLACGMSPADLRRTLDRVTGARLAPPVHLRPRAVRPRWWTGRR